MHKLINTLTSTLPALPSTHPTTPKGIDPHLLPASLSSIALPACLFFFIEYISLNIASLKITSKSKRDITDQLFAIILSTFGFLYTKGIGLVIGL